MFESGYLQVGRWRGIPLRFHWSLALGALAFSGFRAEPAFWLGFVLVVLVHEAGHALLVQRYGKHVLSIDVTGFGGLTRWAGTTSPLQRSVIAWGGVLAQGLLLLVTLGVVAIAGSPRSVPGMQLVSVLTWTNVWIMALNLIPIAPFDGALAWRLFPTLARRGRPRLRLSRRAKKNRVVGDPEAARKMADLLRRVADDAASARRGRS